MKLLLAFAFVNLFAANLCGQPTSNAPVVYRLVDGFPPYQINAQEKGKDGKYTQTIEIGKDGDLYQVVEIIDNTIVVGWIKHVEDGVYGEYDIETKSVNDIEKNRWGFDEYGCVYTISVDHMGRGMWFRYCPER